MKTLSLKSPAKINLNLQILNKREDGYHNLKSEFCTINLFDKIRLTKIPEGIQLVTSGKYRIPNNRDNLAYQVAEKLRSHAKGKVGVKIEIDKQIPLFAGLGGGSSNAATVLKGLIELWNLDLSLEKQVEIGKKIGADVPFFLYGGHCLVEGIGEKVTPLEDKIEEKYVVVAQLPYIKISTPWAYNELDKFKIKNEKVEIQEANELEKELVKKIRGEKLLHPKGFTNENDWGYQEGEKVIIAIYQKEIIGHIAFLKRENRMHIRTLYVDESFRKQNIATQLIQKTIETTHTQNLDIISVHSEKKAVKFYEKNGFVQTGKDEAANGISYPVMKLQLFSINDFEKAIFPHFPDLADLKESFLQAGASKACMTGSGSAVYGIFGRKEVAERCLGEIKEKCKFVWLGETIRQKRIYRELGF